MFRFFVCIFRFVYSNNSRVGGTGDDTKYLKKSDCLKALFGIWKWFRQLLLLLQQLLVFFLRHCHDWNRWAWVTDFGISPSNDQPVFQKQFFRSNRNVSDSCWWLQRNDELSSAVFSQTNRFAERLEAETSTKKLKRYQISISFFIKISHEQFVEFCKVSLKHQN